jgi:tRNA 2-thiocytidine biosynthesis protein TtcA
MSAHPPFAPSAPPRSAGGEARSRDLVTRLERKLLGQVAEASADFGLVEAGDRVMVAVSGGKDSMALLYLLRKIQRRAPFEFELIAVNLDQGHPGFPKHVLPDYFSREGYDFRIVEEDTLSIVQEKTAPGSTYCSLCSRLRRGILYNLAEELGATKIALGHHRDDSIETLMLNLFYSGQIKAMPAKLYSDDGRNVVIRPLIYCAESDIAEFAKEQAFPIVPCNLCGSQENLKRQQVKRLLATLEQDNPKLRGNLLAALGNVRTTHLLDPSLVDRQEHARPPQAPTAESLSHTIPLEALLQKSGRKRPLASDQVAE